MEQLTSSAISKLILTIGTGRRQRAIERAIARGNGGTTAAGVALIRRRIEPLAVTIDADLTDANSGKAGRRATYVALLTGLDPEIAAYITLQVLVGACADPAPNAATMNAVCGDVGR